MTISLHKTTTALFFAIIASTSAAEALFTIEDKPDSKELDILQNGKLRGRYMYNFDDSSGKSRDNTFKTYLQIFNKSGDTAITKALGGDFNHHRGIFIGWNKITIDGETFDCWHGHGAAQLHQEFSAQKATDKGATFTSRLLWEKGKGGPPDLQEERTMTFLPAPDGAYAMLDFTSQLKTLNGKDATLDGDPEHAGIQFRPANEIDRTKTRYLYPKKDAHPHQDVDYPWLGCSFVLDDKTYSVIYLNHPRNPKGAKYSAYRDYARFGAFFKTSLAKNETLTLNIRFIMLESALPSPDWIQAQYNLYTGQKQATPLSTEKGPS